jgi:hypothetical protein
MGNGTIGGLNVLGGGAIAPGNSIGTLNVAEADGHACSGGPPGERNGQYRHGERTKAAIAERQKFSALLKMLRAGLT